jgi:hypothetical protein
MPANEVPEGPVEITMGPGGRATATVVDTEGEPVPDVPMVLTVFPHGQGIGYGMGAGTTDDRGSVTVGPLPPGPTLYLRPSGQLSGRVVEGRRQKLLIEPGAEVATGPIVVDLAGRTLRGVVLDEDQRAVAGATVCATGVEETVNTDEEGSLELTGLPADATIWLVAWHPTKPLFAAERIDPGWGFEPGLVVRPTGRATGRILDDAGEAVVGAGVQCSLRFSVVFGDGSARIGWQPWQTALNRHLGQANLYGGLNATTDAEGKWSLGGLVRGAMYSLSVTLADGTESTAWQEFLTDAEQEVTDVGDITARPRAP